MKLKSKVFKAALIALAPVAKGKAFVPIQSCVKIQTFDRLELTVFDGDQFMVRKLDFNGEIAAICVNYNYLLNSIGDAEETTILQEDGHIVVKCGSKMSKLSTMKVDEFPATPEGKFTSIGVPCADLAGGIRAVHGFESKSRDPLTSTHIVGTAKTIECCAGDGLQFAIHIQALISADFDLMVPAAFCDSLADALDGKNALFGASENMIHVQSDDVEYFCKQAEGKYHTIRLQDYDFTKIGTMETKPLLNELASCLAFREQANTPIMVLEFSAKELWTGFSSSGSTLENRFDGKFKELKCSVNAESFLKCLTPFKETVDISDCKTGLKLASEDTVILMGKMRPA